jgi:nucleoside-triphosphatase
VLEARRLLLTGPPGVGKSTIVERLVDQLRVAGVPVNGFITRELRDEGQRVGFMVETLNGPSAVLAHVSFTAGPKVGRYGVDVSAFDRVAIPELYEAMQRRDLLPVSDR